MAQIKTVSITDLTSYESSGIGVPDSLKIFCNIETDSECSCCSASSGLSWIELFNSSEISEEDISLFFTNESKFVLPSTIIDHEARIAALEDKINSLSDIFSDDQSSSFVIYKETDN